MNNRSTLSDFGNDVAIGRIFYLLSLVCMILYDFFNILR